MGGSSYSDYDYSARVSYRSANAIPTFQHDAAIRSGKKSAGVSDKLNVLGKIRESRDSAAHPESLAIAVIFDETGSMGEVPKILQQKIPQLMGLILRKGYVEHPQILFGAVGDYTNSEDAPIQIGQFESGAEMDDCITEIYLEGKGGGTYHESYQDVLYYFGQRTSIDCYEKRGKRGYLFIIGDEKPYSTSTKQEIKDLFGVDVEGDIPLKQLVAWAKEKYDVFFVIPVEGTAYGRSPELRNTWAQLLGDDHVIALEAAEGVCECIATTIGIAENAVDLDTAAAHLKDAGASDAVVRQVVSGVSNLARSSALAKVGSGDLPVSAKRSDEITRL